MYKRFKEGFMISPAELGLLLLSLPLLVGFLDDPLSQKTAEGNQLFAQGKYQDALEAYQNAQVESPDRPELHFNIGNALEKLNKHDEAIQAYTRVNAPDKKLMEAQAVYNEGVAQFEQALVLESQGQIGEALKKLEECMETNRTAMKKNPSDEDPKYNYEIAKRKWKELYSKNKQDQDQQQQQQQQQNSQNQESAQGQKQDQQNQQDKQGQEEKQQSEQAQKDEKDKGEQQQQAQSQSNNQSGQQGNEGQPEGEAQEHEMSREDALRLLNSLREQNQDAAKQFFNRPIQGSLNMKNDW
ncbi:MAG: tetratricopeptide repeat protein [bacterium]